MLCHAAVIYTVLRSENAAAHTRVSILYFYIHHFLHTVKVCSNFSEPLNKVTQNFMGQNIQLIQYTLLEKTLGCFASR